MNNRINLNPEQCLALKAAQGRHGNRPTSKEYEIEKSVLRLIHIELKPNIRKIPNTKPGYHSNEIKLEPNFNALKDLPAGWGVYSMYDSGGNFRLANAALIEWASIWNNWKKHKHQH